MSPLRRGAIAAGAVAALGAVVAHNAVAVARLRRDAPRLGGHRDHARTVGAGAGPALQMVVLGDSGADGFGIRDPEEAYPLQVARRAAAVVGRPVAVRSHAFSGARTADLVARQLAEFPGRPDLVVASVGVNDALAGRSQRQVAADTERLLQRLDAVAPGATAVLVGAPDLSRAPGLPQPLRAVIGWRCRVVNRAQERVVRRHGIRFGPWPGAPTPEFLGPDGLHPNAAGQTVAALVTVGALLDDLRARRRAR